MRRLLGVKPLFIGLLALMTLVSPLSASLTSAQAEGKVLRVHEVTFPDVVDPQKSSFANEIAILALNFEGLTRQDNDLNTVGAAAEDWDFNEEGDVVTFHLREGLTYSDGSPLTAENFRYAVERTCDPNTAGQYQSILFDVVGCEDFANADEAGYDAAREGLGVQVIDDLTLEISLNGPAPFFPTVASLWVFYPVKQELVEQGGENWWKDPELMLGNGPFQINRWEQDQLVAFEANENYWGGRPQLDGIEYVYQGESAVALEAYRAGDLDIVQLDPSQLPTVQDDPDLVTYPVASTYTMSFNLTLEPFDDIKVREAFSLAFDRETYCAVIRAGDCTSTFSWIPPGLPGSIDTDAYGYDPDAAVQALADSSYGGPDALPQLQMYYNSDDSANTARAEWTAGQYREILGVEIELVPTEGQALVALRKDPSTFPQILFVGGWIQDYPDPQNWLSVYWKCDSTFAQRMAYCNPEFDEVVARADAETDEETRMELYQQAGEILVNDVPGPFLYNLSNQVLVSPAVTGYTPTALDVEWPGQFTSLLTLDKTEP